MSLQFLPSCPLKTAKKSAPGQHLNADFSLFYVHLTFFMFSLATIDRHRIPYDHAFRMKGGAGVSQG